MIIMMPRQPRSCIQTHSQTPFWRMHSQMYIDFYIVIFLLLLLSYIVSLVCEYTAFSILAVVQRQTQYHRGLGNLEGGALDHLHSYFSLYLYKIS